MRGEGDRTPRVSVIMRCKNSDWVIHHALAALRGQRFRDWELIVIDSGSTDRTLEIVRAHGARLVEIPPEDYFPGRVLNLGARLARGELLVFQNSDGVPLGPDALGRLVAAFDDPAVEAALGRQVPRPGAPGWVRREYAASFPEAAEAAPWITLSMPFAAVRRSAWEAHPFYTDAWASEDTEWGLRARRRGAKIAYVKDALVMHSHDYTLRQGWGRRFVEGEADAFLRARPTPAWRVMARALRGAAADARAACGRDGALGELPKDLARRAVDAVAWARGHRLGWRRRRRGDADARLGQRTAIATHPSRR